MIGIKVNPVGSPLIHTKPETVEALVAWLVESGVPKKNIVIWDRFEDMLKEAGYTSERFPGVRIEGLQTMDESEGGTSWRAADGSHVSAANFDQDVFYLAQGRRREERARLRGRRLLPQPARLHGREVLLREAASRSA